MSNVTPTRSAMPVLAALVTGCSFATLTDKIGWREHDFDGDGYSEDDGDCDDTLPEEFYLDADGDGFRNPFDASYTCAPGESRLRGLTQGSGEDLKLIDDCDDTISTIGAACPWRDLSVSDRGGCGVRGNGLVVCWGPDPKKVPVDAPQEPFVRVDLADFPNTTIIDACGVRADGTLTCWDGALVDQAPSGEFTDVSVGTWHACALTTSGEAACFGANFAGETSPPAGVQFTQVLAVDQYSLGLDTAGTVHSWGLGLRFPHLGAFPETVACTADLRSADCEASLIEALNVWGQQYEGGVRFLAAGERRVCGLAGDREVYCVGDAETVANGDGEALRTSDIDGRFDEIATSAFGTCALVRGGAVDCVGTDGFNNNEEHAYDHIATSIADNGGCGAWSEGTQGGALECWGAVAVPITLPTYSAEYDAP